MTIESLLNKVILEYPEAVSDNFKEHPFAKYFRNTIPTSIASSLELSDMYSIKASAGNGAWAKIPWIAIFNKLITESVTSGFYCVYLFRADCSGVYLSLNQGIADKRDEHGLGVSRNILRDQARLFRNLLGEGTIVNFADQLDLKLDFIPKETTSRRLGLAYEAGNIVSKFYAGDKIPDNQLLIKDLEELLGIYATLFEKFSLDENAQESNGIETEWFEDLTKYRMHRVTERNQKLSNRVKQLQGYICKACNFDFESRYGRIGKEFIEAHHTVPIASLNKARIKLDPIQDFTVLCSNCHRMIHRIKPTPTLEEFKKILQ